MNFGFDLDKVFVDYPPLIPATIIDRIYKKRSKDRLLYRIPSRPEQMLRIISHYSLFRPPIAHNIAFVKQLAQNKKNKHYLISSRFGFLKRATNRLTKRYSFDEIFSDMHFNYDNMQPHEFKDKTIKKLHIDRYVDDDLDLVKYLALHNPKTQFFWLNSALNKRIHKNLSAITDIAGIIK